MSTPPDLSARRLDPRLAVPTQREGGVLRELVLARLRDAAGLPLVSVVAPGGYGKTTSLAQWAASEGRPAAWVTLDPGDDDPFRLALDIASALELADLATVPAELARAPPLSAFWSTLVPVLRTLVAAIDEPFALVLDDVQHLRSREALDLVGVLSGVVPASGQLVLCGRAELTPVVSPARVRREVLELGVADLRLTRAEARALLADVGLDADEEQADALNRRAEGWAAGLALGGLAQRLAGESGNVAGPASLDRFVEDYLRVEHLSAVSQEELAFLLDTAVLDRLAPALCDAVRGRDDSRALLEELERASRFVEALDHERETFRYHELFRAALVRELERTDAGAAARLRVRAAAWCAEHGFPSDAIAYAHAAGDLDLTARIFGAHAIGLWREGHQSTLTRWLEELDRPEVLDRNPALGPLGALAHALAGDAFHAELWLDRAQRQLAGLPADPQVGQLRGVASLCEAMLCRNGPEQMRRAAETAVAAFGPAHPLVGGAVWLDGVALALGGERGAAVERLRTAFDDAVRLGGTHAAIGVSVWLARLALAEDDPAEAEAWLSRGEELHDADRFAGYLSTVQLRAQRALLDGLAGDEDAARAGLAALQRERPQVGHAIPWIALEIFTSMARAFLVLGDPGGAGAVLVDAAEVLRRRPDLGCLGDEVAALRARASATADGDWSSSLTAAELRLLPLLTTHLTFREIGERLFVSRNTVKTQAISIYRKLGASSRGEAVARAGELGLVDLGSGAGRFTPRG